MKLKDYAKREGEVLEWVNEQRRKYGREDIFVLRVGKRGNAKCCPVANSLGQAHSSCWVTSKSYGMDGDPVGKSLPKFVSEFVIDFDDDQFPWLEDK